MILRQGQVFRGSASASGQVSLGTGRAEFAAVNQPAFDIRYRLPKVLPPLAPYKGAADLSVIEASTPGSPDRQVVLRTGGALLYAGVFRKSPEPVRLEIAPGVSVSQMPAEVNAQNRMAASSVQARDATGAVTEIPVGEVTRVRMAGVVLDVFIRASYRVMPIPKEQDEGGGYILEGWAVRSTQP